MTVHKEIEIEVICLSAQGRRHKSPLPHVVLSLTDWFVIYAMRSGRGFSK